MSGDIKDNRNVFVIILALADKKKYMIIWETKL